MTEFSSGPSAFLVRKKEFDYLRRDSARLQALHKGCRQENIDDEVLSFHERLVFDAMSLADYERHRAKRGLPRLTPWQHQCLTTERVAAALKFL
jgi:hypothetical protein